MSCSLPSTSLSNSSDEIVLLTSPVMVGFGLPNRSYSSDMQAQIQA